MLSVRIITGEDFVDDKGVKGICVLETKEKRLMS